jgi:hypothetical protein
VRETPLYQRGVAGASIDAPGPYRPKDKTYYNVTPLDGADAGTGREQPARVQQLDPADPEHPRGDPGPLRPAGVRQPSPSLVKSLFGNGAMVEGWAVYGERMMLESGYGDNAPEMWLMYSKWNLRSVTNTILDYSVHVLGMTEEQAIDLLVRQAFQTRRKRWRNGARAAVVGAADQLFQRLQRDHGIARATQAAAGSALQPEAVPRPVPQLRQCAGAGDQGPDDAVALRVRNSCATAAFC